MRALLFAAASESKGSFVYAGHQHFRHIARLAYVFMMPLHLLWSLRLARW
jgi:hypothetical protein